MSSSNNMSCPSKNPMETRSRKLRMVTLHIYTPSPWGGGIIISPYTTIYFALFLLEVEES
jgi:hypothetical protein